MLDGVRMVNSNKYDAVTNPNGIINLGVAENQLMTKELTEIVRILSIDDNCSQVVAFCVTTNSNGAILFFFIFMSLGL